jgi:DivIVA domain-containing protein
MDLTSKMLRDVEFRDRLRGYDTDEVDEFLEQVAVGVDELHAQLLAARTQAASAPQAPAATRAAIEEDDSIRRTLVLAQRTADLAIAEAKEEASRLLDEAHAEAERLVTDAREEVVRLESAAESELKARVARLNHERDDLERAVSQLTALVDAERTRLTENLGALVALVSNLGVSDTAASIAAARPTTSTPPPPFLADDPATEEVFEAEAADLDLNLDDLAISRPITTPTPTYAPPTDPALTTEVDEALWERWAASGDGDDRRVDDPFNFGHSNE